MSKKGRLILLIVCIGLAIVMSVTATIVVLVARVSTVGSNVNIEYKTTDNVNVRASAQYAYGNTTSSMTSGGLASGGTSIVISASNKTASLSPTAKISFDSSVSRVVFRYTFTNLMASADVGIELAENRTTTNTTTRYAYSDTAISDYTVFDDTSITYGEYTKQVIGSTTAGNSTKYIYIIVDITNIMRDATYTNTVTWTLTREEGVTLTFDTSSADKVVDGNNTTVTLANFSGSNATTTILAGTTMSNTTRVVKNGKAIDPIFYPLKDNKMFIGWTTDSANAIDNPSCVVDLSSTTFAEDTTLYPAFMTGTIPTSAYSLLNNEYTVSKSFTYDGVAYGSQSDVSATINAFISNDTFVIPDIYNGLPVTSINYSAQAVYRNDPNIGMTVTCNYGIVSGAGCSYLFVGNYWENLQFIFESYWDNMSHQSLVSRTDNIVIGRSAIEFEGGGSEQDVNFAKAWNLLSAPITTIRVMPGNGVYYSRENCNCVIETATNKVVKTSNNSVIPNSVKSSNVIQLMNRTAYPSTTTKNGVTFTNNGDGTITLSGTSTASGYLAIMQYPEANNGHTLLLTGCPAGGTSSTYYISLANQGAGTQDYGNGVIKKTDTSLMRYVSIVFRNNVTFNNVTFTPQLFDLTVMYGEGKEPTTVAEFRSKYGSNYYEYNTDTNGYLDWKNMSGNTTITSINIPEGVTEIPASAFKGCTALTNVVFPSTLVSIGNNAFYGCSALTSVTLPASLQIVGEQAFYNCTALKTVTFTKGAKLEIGAKAFFGCSVLATVNMPSTIYSIGDQAFNGNYATVANNKAMACSDASGKYWFHKSTSIANTANIANWDNVVAIATGAFDGNTSLTTASIPSEVKYIGTKTFNGCSNLATLTCNGKVEYIGDSAFNGCSKITNFDASNARYIGTYAFGICTSLVSVTTGNKLTYIGPSAFRACTSLTSFVIPDSVTEINDYTFYTCSSLANVTMSKNLTKIGACAFYRTALTEVTIPEGVTSIGNYAFYDLQNLATLNLNAISLSDLIDGSQVFYQVGKTASNGGFVLNIGSKVKRIPDYMFYVTSATTYAPYISAVNIPQDNVLTEFGQYSFAYVQGSFSININHDISSIYNYAFSNSKIKDFIIQGSVASAFRTRSFEATSNMDNFIVYGDVYQTDGSFVFRNSAVKTIKFLGSISATSATYKKIGAYFAQNCTQLTTVVLPNKITSVGSYAFNGCSTLTSVVLPDSITSLGTYSFKNCTSLTTVRLPKGLTSISAGSFEGASSLATINNYTSRITAIKASAFHGTGLTSFDTLDGVTTIGNNAFESCTKLKTLRIGSAVKKIGTNVLTGTTNVSVTMAVTSGWVAATSATATTGTALTFGADGSANYTVFMNNKTSYINRP